MFVAFIKFKPKSVTSLCRSEVTGSGLRNVHEI